MPDVNVICLVRGDGHHWVFLYDDANRSEALQQAARWAADPRLPFTWRDAAEVSQRMRTLNP